MRWSLQVGSWVALSAAVFAACGGGASSSPGVSAGGTPAGAGTGNGGSVAGGSAEAGSGASAGTLAGAGGSAGSGGAPAAGSAGVSPIGVSGAAGMAGTSGLTLPAGTPSTVLLDGALLARTRAALTGSTSGTPEQQVALANLVAAAELALQSGTWSVTTKDAAYVVNQDPHEYVSWAPYFWPSDASPPSKAGTFGKCPYVSHDGVRNPDVAKVTDRHGLHASSEAILELALAWYFTGKTAYADQAELVARTWYLNAATAMNPSLAHAQSNGPCGAGTSTGIIEAGGGYLTDALDGLSILALDTRDNGWGTADVAGMKAWLGKFVTFLLTSSLGKTENAATNNHGTWFDASLSSIYLYEGDLDSAKTLVTASRQRLDSQIMSDGREPLELARPTSWHYSNYDVAAFCRLAGVASHVGVDLWGYRTPSGASIVKAAEFLIPTATTANPPGPWAQYNDITMPFDAAYQSEAYYSIRAAAVYGNDAAAQAVFAESPVPIMVPGHLCAGDRFPLGSDFCGITPGNQPFADLQAATVPAVDMWPLIPTCRVPID
jgi:hypothetical protein